MASKLAIEQNKKMYEVALFLWKESGYTPDNIQDLTPEEPLRIWDQYYKFVMYGMREKFSGIPESRIRNQVMRAKSKIYSDWVKNRQS